MNWYFENTSRYEENYYGDIRPCCVFYNEAFQGQLSAKLVLFVIPFMENLMNKYV